VSAPPVPPRAPARDVLALPTGMHAGMLAVAVAGVSFSGPLMAATVAPALAIAFWRNLLGAVASILALARRPSRLRDLAGKGRSVATAAGAGLLLAVHFATWVPSLTMTSVASATALVSTQGIFAALIARIQGAHVPRAAWWGSGIAVLGVLLVTGVDVSLSARAAAGDVIALVAGAAAALYMSAGARARQTLSTAEYTAVCYGSASIALLLACLVGGQALSGYPADSWWKIIAVTVCAQLLGHTLMNAVVGSTSPTVVALALLLEVPGAAVIAYVWLGQHPPLSAVPGLALLIAGLVVVTRARPVRAAAD
jgi:drug/metabolite transporter (DMT)-like permease